MSVSRRAFVACLACACAAACIDPVAGDTSDTGDTDGPEPDVIDAGRVQDYLVGDLVPVGGGVAVGRDAGGFYAISTICTHRGCDMASEGVVGPDGLDCDCHGSRFAADGSVIEGPARDPLPFFAVAIGDDGVIDVDPDAVVEPTVRAQVTG